MQDIDCLFEKLRTAYQPHKDYDSTERLATDIKKAVNGMEQRLKSSGVFSDSELQSIRSDWLRIAVDCIRQCGNMEQDSQTVTTSQEITQTQ